MNSVSEILTVASEIIKATITRPTPEVVEPLRLAKSFIDTPEKITAEPLSSLDAQGNEVQFDDPKAVSHCVGHAIDLACLKMGIEDSEPIHIRWFGSMFVKGGFIGLDLKKDHKKIMKIFDKAIGV